MLLADFITSALISLFVIVGILTVYVYILGGILYLITLGLYLLGKKIYRWYLRQKIKHNEI